MSKQVIKAEQLKEINEFLNDGAEAVVIMAIKPSKEKEGATKSLCLIAGNNNDIHGMIVENMKRIPEVIELFGEAIEHAESESEGLDTSAMVTIAKTLKLMQDENPKEFAHTIKAITPRGN